MTLTGDIMPLFYLLLLFSFLKKYLKENFGGFRLVCSLHNSQNCNNKERKKEITTTTIIIIKCYNY